MQAPNVFDDTKADLEAEILVGEAKALCSRLKEAVEQGRTPIWDALIDAYMGGMSVTKDIYTDKMEREQIRREEPCP